MAYVAVLRDAEVAPVVPQMLLRASRGRRFTSLSSPTVVLPSSVYTDVANVAVPVVTVAKGRYHQPSFFHIQRPVIIDGSESTIYWDPATESGGSSWFPWLIDSTIDPYTGPVEAGRVASRLTGTIVAGTTTLTMHADEIVDVTAGERVTIMAGVNEEDPNECYKFIIAEILSVVGQTITWTAALAVDVPTYADEAAFTAEVHPSQHFKIGPWGDEFGGGAGWSKGFLGTDHGMIRYVGSMTHDVTIKNVNFELLMPTPAQLNAGMMEFWVQDMLRFTLDNVRIHNIIQSFVHSWRSDDVVVNNLRVRGESKNEVNTVDVIAAGEVMSAWGGKNISYTNLDVRGKNITLGNTEINPENILFRDLYYDVKYERTWNFSSAASALQFSGATLGTGVRIEDAYLKIVGDFNDVVPYGPSGVPFTFKNLVIPTPLVHYFDFSLHLLEGTFSLDGISYGTLTADSETLVRTAVNGKKIFFPKGFYRSARFRVTVPGGVTAIGDGAGNDYSDAIASGEWTDLFNWYAVSGATMAAYFAKLYLIFNFSGGSSITVETEIQYYPAPDDAGWVMN